MANAQMGLPTPAAVAKVLDAAGRWLKYGYSTVGRGQSETTTLAAYAQQARTEIMGDGTTSNPGIDSAQLQTLLAAALNNAPIYARYDVQAQTLWGPIVRTLESWILQALPSGWNWTSGGLHALDAYLRRCNANNSETPTRPVQATVPTLVGATGGSLATGVNYQAAYTYIGAGDYMESAPSATTIATALTGFNSGFTLGNLPATVPSGVTACRVYRTMGGVAGAADFSNYYYEREVAQTAGAAFATMACSVPDVALRTDIRPPQFASALMGPEQATVYALAFASLSQTAAGTYGPMTWQQYGMLRPSNCVLNPANGYLGPDNPAVDGILAQWASTTKTYGTLRSTSSYSAGLLGWVGAYGVRARVTSALNAAVNNGSMTVTYNYLDVDNPSTPATGATVTPAGGLAATLGSVLDVGIPAGRIVTAITSVVLTGPATGTIVWEALPVRAL